MRHALSRKLVFAFGAALMAASGAAAANSLDNPKEVDIAHVDEPTGQLTLYVVPGSERIVDRGSVDRLRRKLNTYARYARSGQAYADEPRANRSLVPMLAVIVTMPVSSVERGNLDGIKLQYRYTDIRFSVEEIDPLPGKNIRIGVRHRIE